MSYKYREAAWGLRSELDPAGALVLMELAERTNGDLPVERGAWPSLATLAKSLGMGRATAKRAVYRLIAAGWIEREIRPLESSIYRLSEAFMGRVKLTLGWDQIDPRVGSDRPQGRVKLTPHPRNGTKEENQGREPSPLPPKGDGVEDDPLFEEWERTARVGKGNPCVEIEGIVKRTKRRLSQLRGIDRVIQAKGRSWDALRAGLEAYEQPERLTPWVATVGRLASDEDRISRLLGLAPETNGTHPTEGNEPWYDFSKDVRYARR